MSLAKSTVSMCYTKSSSMCAEEGGCGETACL
jgi:hypothetical protein